MILGVGCILFSDEGFGIRVVEELERRWRSMFEALAKGDDVPPGERLRAEGMMEAAVLVGMLKANTYYNPVRHPDRVSRNRCSTEIGDRSCRENCSPCSGV